MFRLVGAPSGRVAKKKHPERSVDFSRNWLGALPEGVAMTVSISLQQPSGASVPKLGRALLGAAIPGVFLAFHGVTACGDADEHCSATRTCATPAIDGSIYTGDG